MLQRRPTNGNPLDDESMLHVALNGLNEYYNLDGTLRLSGWLSNDGRKLCIVDYDPSWSDDDSDD